MLTRCIVPALAFAGVLAFVSRAGAQATVPSPQPMYSWRGMNGSGVFPAKDLVSEFWDVPEGAALPANPKELGKLSLPTGAKPGTRKNIVWCATLPHWGHNAPVVVGRKVFLLTAEGWKSDCPELVCLDAENNDYHWCIGDPAKPFVPPEAVKP